jgi:hypothetical protein
MANRQKILERWEFPHWQKQGITLVARSDARACVQRILNNGCRFYGYDAFRVDGESIQPFLEFSSDWSDKPVPSFEVIIGQLASHPNKITHYEFVFEDRQ